LLLLLLAFAVGVATSWVALSQALQRQAERAVTARGAILTDMMNAVRDYTRDYVAPLLDEEPEAASSFPSEMIPAFSARTVFADFRSEADYADFTYKEAALAPRNPNDQADDFEESLLAQFRSDPTMTEISDFRNISGENVYYIARPLSVPDESCLSCHGTSDSAPQALIAEYGAENGFGWEVGEVVAAQMVYVPAEEVQAIAWESFSVVMVISASVFAALLLFISLFLRGRIIAPVTQLGGLAQKLGAQELHSEEELEQEIQALSSTAARSDELGQLTTVFSKMAREVYAREQQLKQQVKKLIIVIDEVQRARDVTEITQSAQFQELREQAKRIREEA